MQISQEQARDLFDLPTRMLYVCDGKRECGKPSCLDWDAPACHHTSDKSHALYPDHDEGTFTSQPATRGDEAVILRKEPIRGR